MSDNNINETKDNNDVKESKQFPFTPSQIKVLAGIAGFLVILIAVTIIFVMRGRNNVDNNVTPTSSLLFATPYVTAPVHAENDTVTNTPTPIATNTPAPVTGTVSVTNTPTPAPTDTPTPAATYTPVPTETLTTTITAKEAYEVLKKYSKESLNIDREVSEYRCEYDDVTTTINGTECYRFNLTEEVGGKMRNRGEFYISQDGKACFVFDLEKGSFIPLPLG